MGEAPPACKFTTAARDMIAFHVTATIARASLAVMAFLLPSLLLSFAAAAGQAPASLPPGPPQVVSHRLNRTFISPMGEPFRPSGRDDDTLADWFRQADRNHDGQLTLDEMQQDAERFFAVLDVGHDGEIDPDDITRYEQVVAPEIQSGASFGMAVMESAEQPNRGEGRRGGGGGGGGGGYHRGGGDSGARGGRAWGGGRDDDSHQGASRFGLLDLPEPVVSADSDFNRGVSLTEFRRAAAQRFIALDIDHRGQLSLAGLETIRPAPAPAGNKAARPKDTDDQN